MIAIRYDTFDTVHIPTSLTFTNLDTNDQDLPWFILSWSVGENGCQLYHKEDAAYSMGRDDKGTFTIWNKQYQYEFGGSDDTPTPNVSTFQKHLNNKGHHLS